MNEPRVLKGPTILRNMTNPDKLRVIKAVHTLIWIFYNVVIGYMLYAVIAGRLDWKLWVCYLLVAIEGIILLIFQFVCPLTIIARNYSDSQADNFDIYLPRWLAKHSKRIYTGITLAIISITIYRMLS